MIMKIKRYRIRNDKTCDKITEQNAQNKENENILKLSKYKLFASLIHEIYKHYIRKNFSYKNSFCFYRARVSVEFKQERCDVRRLSLRIQSILIIVYF